jgi:transcriptional regulator with XRE-family HTH domain
MYGQPVEPCTSGGTAADTLDDDQRRVLLAVIGVQIQRAREVSGASIAAIAELLNVPGDRVMHAEEGKLPLSAVELWDLAAILKKPLSYFFPNPSHSDA